MKKKDTIKLPTGVLFFDESENNSLAGICIRLLKYKDIQKEITLLFLKKEPLRETKYEFGKIFASRKSRISVTENNSEAKEIIVDLAFKMEFDTLFSLGILTLHSSKTDIPKGKQNLDYNNSIYFYYDIYTVRIDFVKLEDFLETLFNKNFNNLFSIEKRIHYVVSSIYKTFFEKDIPVSEFRETSKQKTLLLSESDLKPKESDGLVRSDEYFQISPLQTLTELIPELSVNTVIWKIDGEKLSFDIEIELKDTFFKTHSPQNYRYFLHQQKLLKCCDKLWVEPYKNRAYVSEGDGKPPTVINFKEGSEQFYLLLFLVKHKNNKIKIDQLKEVFPTYNTTEAARAATKGLKAVKKKDKTSGKQIFENTKHSFLAQKGSIRFICEN